VVNFFCLAGVRPDQIRVTWVSNPTIRRRRLLSSTKALREDKQTTSVTVRVADIPKKRRDILRRLALHKVYLERITRWKTRGVSVTNRRPLKKGGV
jgi:hypothetical protein